jgi:hypothetical protein
MKKFYLALIFTGIINTAFSQTKTSGTVTLTTGFTLKIDVNSVTQKATFTMVGSTTRWLSIGLNCTSMNSSNDCISYNTSLRDQHLCGGYCSPIDDATNNLSTPIITNPTTSSRQIVFTRDLNTLDSKDYTFNYATLSSLNIIWCVGTSNTNQEHGSKGFKTLTFTTLGTEDFVSLENNVNIFPNPSNGLFNISKSNTIEISKIKVFDTNAKLLKEIVTNIDNQNNAIDLSELSKGIYFIEISNKDDKTVKKIIKY